MKFLLDGSMIVIDGPKINVQDGYYHRIRGIRSRNQILLEVDQYQTVYRLYSRLNIYLSLIFLKIFYCLQFNQVIKREVDYFILQHSFICNK